MFGKAWCYHNPNACNELVFPWLGWAFLIWGLIPFYRIYKWPSRERWYEFVAAPFFTLLGLAGVWVSYFPLPSWAVL